MKYGSFPYAIFPDPFTKEEGVKSGVVIHRRKPRFKCRFEYCDELPEETGRGLSTYNVDTGVLLTELELFGKKVHSIKEISQAMKDTAWAVNAILRPNFP